MSKLKIPESWAEAKLENITEKITDGSHNPPKAQADGLPMLSCRNIKNGELVFDEFRYISKNEFEREHRRTQVSENDVLLSIVGTIGSTAVVKKEYLPVTLQRSVAVIGLVEGILPNYLRFFLNSPMGIKFLESNSAGSTQKGIYLKSLRSMNLPLAPKLEQNRIVAKIESTQEKIKMIESSISKSEQLIEILALSFLKNFESAILGDFYEERIDRFAESSEKNTRMIGVSNEKGVVALRTEKKVDKSKYKWVKRGDVFYNPMRLNVRSVALYLDDLPAITSPEYVVVRPKLLGGGWLLFYYLRSKRGQEEIKKRTKGSVRERVYFKNLSTLPFGKIDDSNQKKLATAETFLTTLQLQINFLRDSLLKIEKVILEKAFAGELVSQKADEGTGHDLLGKINNSAAEAVEKTFNKASMAKKITGLPTKKKVRK